MKEHPIIFSGSMVRAILDGKKTQTRRVIKHQPSGPEIFPPNQFCDQWYFRDAYYACEGNDIGRYVSCPYGVVGDRLWVRETFCPINITQPLERYTLSCYRARVKFAYAADHATQYRPVDAAGNERLWKPAIHMPRWASRITLEVVSVRADRLQEISEADARAEGASCCLWYEPFGKEEGDSINLSGDAINPVHPSHGGERGISYRNGFATLWDSINAKRGYGWDTNPYVWVIEFKKV